MTEQMFECYNITVAVERRYNVNTNENGSSLTDKQKEAARALVRSGLTPTEFFQNGDIPENEWTAWLEDEDFLSYVSALAIKNAHANEPFVWSTLIRSIKEKDNNVTAIRLFLSLFDKKRPAAAENTQTDSEIDSLRSDLFGEEGAEE